MFYIIEAVKCFCKGKKTNLTFFAGKKSQICLFLPDKRFRRLTTINMIVIIHIIHIIHIILWPNENSNEM
jgi:hypothetical protein